MYKLRNISMIPSIFKSLLIKTLKKIKEWQLVKSTQLSERQV